MVDLAVPVFEKDFEVDLLGKVKTVYAGEAMYTGDADADTITVTVKRGGADFPVSGTVVGKCLRADGLTVPMTGTATGNKAKVTVNAQCCEVAGPIAILVQVTDGSTNTTLIKVMYTVEAGETGAVVDPGTILPSIAELIQRIEDVSESIPADYSSLVARVEGLERLIVLKPDILPTYAEGVEVAQIVADGRNDKLFIPDLGLVVVDGRLCVEYEA